MSPPLAWFGSQTWFACITLPLPEAKNPKILAERVNKFFTSRIEKIMAGLVPTETHSIDKSYIEST